MSSAQAEISATHRAGFKWKEGKGGKEERAHLPLQVRPGVQVHPFIYLRSISPHLPNPLCLITLGMGSVGMKS